MAGSPSSSAGPGPSGGAPAGETPAVPTSKVAATQQQLDGVKSTMAANIELLLDRGEKLQDLDSRADELGEGAKRFKTSATRVERKMKWQKWKWRLICLVILLILCSGLITGLIYALK